MGTQMESRLDSSASSTVGADFYSLLDAVDSEFIANDFGIGIYTAKHDFDNHLIRISVVFYRWAPTRPDDHRQIVTLIHIKVAIFEGVHPSDETVIRLDDERYWLYAAVDPDTNELLHAKLEPTRTNVLAHGFLQLREKHGTRDSAERVFCEAKRRTAPFSNCFSHADAETADQWFRSFALVWGELM